MNEVSGAKAAPDNAGAESGRVPSSRPLPLNSQPPAIPDHELIRCIGHGSYGEVWLARSKLGTLRAVKIVYRRSFEDSRPFEREFKGIQKFEPISRSHEGLVDILQVGGGEEYFYYVMELADDAQGRKNEEGRMKKFEGGQSAASNSSFSILHSPLEHYTPRTLRSEVRRLGRLLIARCLDIGQSLASALAHLHAQGLVHRDIKPSNIIFVQGAPKLADIGLVADASEARSFVGTEGFIPPEGPGAAQADLYSLGKVLYEISTGRDRRDFPSLPDDLAEEEAMLELNAVILKTCKNDLRERYQSAAEIQADLALLQSGRSVKRLHIVERRLALATNLGFAVGALMLIAVAAYLLQRWQTRQVTQEKKIAERLLYVADMNLAHQAFEEGDVVRAKNLLKAHRPKPGTEDLRGFEWYHVNYLCRDDDPLRTLRGHEEAVKAVAVSPDGKIVASGSADNTVKLWNLQTGEVIATLTGHSKAVNSVSFSRNGNILASGSNDNTIKLWNISTHQVIGALTNHTAAVNAVAFSPDGKWLASGSYDRSLRLWDVLSLHESVAFTNYSGPVIALAFSGDGRQLVTASFETYDPVRIYDVEHLQQPDYRLFYQAGFISSVAFSPDGTTVAWALGHAVVLWDVAHRKLITTLKEAPGINSVIFSPDGTKLATSSDNRTVRLWDLGSKETIATFKGHASNVTSVVFSPDGKALVSGSDDHIVKVWDISALRDRDVLRGHSDGVYRIAFSPDDKTLASASRDHTLRLWDVESGTNIATLTGHTDVVTGVVFAPDGKTIYSCSLDRSIRAWDFRTRKQIAVLTNHTKGIHCLALSPDGSTLASGTGWWIDNQPPNELIFWDVPNRKMLSNIVANQALIHWIQFSPDGKTVVSSDDDRTTIFWDVASGQARLTLTNRASEPTVLVVAGSNDTLQLWDVGSGRTVVALPSLDITGSCALAFSPDGKRLAVHYIPGQVKLWDHETGRDTITLSGHDHYGYSLLFTRDGQTMATASFDNTIRLWRAPRP
jgi:WD40 repeat protein